MRHTQEGLDVALDFNAEVVVNVGRSQPAGEDPPAHEPDPEASATTDDPEEGKDR